MARRSRALWSGSDGTEMVAGGTAISTIIGDSTFREFVYVPNEYDNTVSVIDTGDNSHIATIPIGGNATDTAAISPSGALVRTAGWPT